MIVVGGSASNTLSRELARQLECKLADVDIRRFPDQECYVKVQESLDEQDVIIVQSTYPDQNIVELFLLQDAVRNAGATRIITVVPYFGYARQDKSFKIGEAVSARLLARHISMGSDYIFTIDIHNPDILSDFTVPVQNLSAMPTIGRWLHGNSVDIIVSPDEGSKDRASLAAEAADCPWDFLQKTRIDGQIVEIKPKNLDVDGKVVAIVDDIIATGGTMITAASQLKEQGASRVIAACTHGLFTGGSVPRLENVFDLVISTDSLERPTSRISAAACIKNAVLDDTGY